MEDTNREIRSRGRSNVWMGLLLLVVGGALLLRQLGYPLPHWLFTWEMIVIAVGVGIGLKHRFQDFSWLILVLIGLIFLSDDIYPDISLKKYAVPIVFISIGLLFIFAPRRMCRGGRHRQHRFRAFPREGTDLGVADTDVQEAIPVEKGDSIHDTTLDLVSIFAGIKKNILSKQFKGGEVVCVFGGAEINLTNADFVSPVIIDVVNVFGGTKLIIPSNWEVRSEATAIFGGIDDKRAQPTSVIPEKIIILKGTLMFGGIEIKSF